MAENNNSSRMNYIVKNLNYMLLMIAIIVVGFFLCKLVSCGKYVETKEKVLNIAKLDARSVDYHVVAEITGSFSADRSISKEYGKDHWYEWKSTGIYTFSCIPIFQYYVDWDEVVIQESGSMLNIYIYETIALKIACII